MLIPYAEIKTYLETFGIKVRGALHLGAHDCEELPFYHMVGLKSEEVVWIDALEHKVRECQSKGIPNVFHAVIGDEDGKEIVFNRTSNDQSSSLLPLGTHAQEYPWITVTQQIPMKTTTLDTFFKTNNLDMSRYNLWNFDIQGAEMLALKGASEALKHVNALYMEVNQKELYKGCALLETMDDFLKEHNFVRVDAKFVSQGWGDALYIRV
jgi:FkbM family methyltransferase